MPAEDRLACPHCSTAFHWNPETTVFSFDIDYFWRSHHQICPTCEKMIVMLSYVSRQHPSRIERMLYVYPKTAQRRPLSRDVPETFAQDYREASLVLADSPKASAALSRRCLQNVLRQKAGVQKPSLAQEIGEVIKSNQLPMYLAKDIDAIRHIGNFAAHPTKDTNTGEIVAVEPGEAEWLLDLLEGLFDFYFVQPAEMQRKRDALNAKLTAAGKQPMK